MNQKFLSLLLLIAIFISLFACQKEKEHEKKEVKEREQAGCVLNFKPNDVFRLVPDKTIILQESSTVNQNNCFLDVVAKGLDHVSEISFDLISDPAYVTYRDYKSGILFEETRTPVYEVSLEGGKKGRLKIKIFFESGSGEISGSGKIVNLCFEPLKDGQVDFTLEKGKLLDLEKKDVAGVTWIGGILYVAR